MPVPQENLSFVKQASCLFLTMVQDVSGNKHRVEIESELRKAKLACIQDLRLINPVSARNLGLVEKYLGRNRVYDRK